MVVSKPWHIILNRMDACLLVHKIAGLRLFPEQLSSYCYGTRLELPGEAAYKASNPEYYEREIWN